MKPVRRNQALAPFGVGAMVDFPGPISLIHCGLDAWPYAEDNPQHREFRIDDEQRLANYLGVRYFVQPPDFRLPQHGEDASQINLNLRLPFLRFPRWHVCPRCGLMRDSQLHDKTAPICRGPIGTGKAKGKPHPSRKMAQVRFVAACIDGHLQDFPWREWLFRDPTPQRLERLRMITAGSASLAGVRIVCESEGSEISVIKSGTLSGAFGFELGEPSPLSKIGVQCCGENPALGIPSSIHPAPGCGNDLYPLLRGGSNVYFARIASSIYIPPADSISGEEVLEILEDSTVRNFLSMMADADKDRKVTAAVAQVVLAKYYPQSSISAEDLAGAANRRFSGAGGKVKLQVSQDSPDQAFRREEYEVFRSDVLQGYPKTNLLIRSESLASYEPFVSEFIERISLVHKLRETRAFIGFSRIFPESQLSELLQRKLISRQPKDWLPGVVVRGEGIFFQFRESLLAKWLNERGKGLTERITSMMATLDQLRTKRHQQPRQVTPRSVLLHTFSHLIINQLIFECGYGSASLRERLYYSDGDSPMSGILIYTAAGDSEGTMGGLVRLGRAGRIEGVIRRAIEKARWCSTDPVCIESQGQGPDNCNLAACHSCALLPETSCEEQNRLLDRGLVVGTLREPDLGFFSSVT